MVMAVCCAGTLGGERKRERDEGRRREQVLLECQIRLLIGGGF